MAQDKPGFIIYNDKLELIEKLIKQDRSEGTNHTGELFYHILQYVNDRDPDPVNFIVDISFEPIKQNLKRDLRKYEDIRKKRSEYGKKGAEAKLAKAELAKAKKPKAKNGEANQAVIDKDIVKVRDTVRVKENNTIDNKAFVDSCKVKSQWSETTAMKFKVSIEVINVFLDQFEQHLVTMDEQKQSEKDFKAHFIHWLNKQPLEMHRNKPVGKSNQRQTN